jgi:flagellar protein FlbT
MSLKLNLKPHEKIIIGGAVLRNGERSTELHIENNVPLLRQKDIMNEDEAHSPARRIYFAIQLMYIDNDNRDAYLETLLSLVKDVANAAPSTAKYLTQLSDLVSTGQLYQALKISRQLIDYEKELLAHVANPT